MTAVAGADVAPSASGAAQERPRWQQVALPTEHGGWSLTAEPAVLGLIVAWSAAGALLAIAAMLMFLARTPLKLVLVDRWRGRWLPRSRLAAIFAAVEVALIVLLGLLAAGLAVDGRWWMPLAAAAPLIALELWFDMRSRSRRLVPEVAGTVGIGSVAAVVALAGGATVSVALGLWCVVAARGAAAIPYVRTQVFRLHGRAPARWSSDLAQALAVAAVAAGWALDAVPLAAVVAIAVVGVVNVVLVRRRPRPAKVIGVQQMVFGILVVTVTAVAVLAGPT